MRLRRCWLRLVLSLALAFVGGVRALVAQDVVRGTVRDSASRQPILGAVLVLVDSGGRTIASGISNERGEYRLALSSDARRLRAARLGFRPREAVVPAPVNGVAQLDVVLVLIPMLLEPVRVTAAANCPRRRDRAAALALLEQARAGLLATVVARADSPATMIRLLVERTFDGRSDRIVRQTVRIDSAARTLSSFNAAHTATDFVRQGFMEDSAGSETFFAPDAEVLLDDGFARGYCFHIADPDRTRPNQVGLGFRSADGKRGRVDIDGALWIDTVARALVDIEFRYVGLDRRIDAFRPGGSISFGAMANGVVLVNRWALRLVELERDTTRVTTPGGRVITTAELALQSTKLTLHEVGGELARATWPDGYTWQAPLGTLRLRVVTQRGTPAVGTVVRLDDTEYQGVADSTGRLEITNLAPGPYAAEIVDSRLAAIGVTLVTPLKFVAIRDSTIESTLRVRTAEDYAMEGCGGDPKAVGDALLIGRVLTSDGKPVSGARWTILKQAAVDWQTLVENAGSGSDGLFHFCALSRGDMVTIRVGHDRMIPAQGTATLTQKLTIVTIHMSPRK